MRICKIKNCGKKHYAKSFCVNHYWKFKKYGNPLHNADWFKPKFCKIKNCGLRHYAKGYCHKHWKNVRTWKHPLGKRLGIMHKCYVYNCKSRTLNKYCNYHYRRFKKGLPLTYKISTKGKYNINWRGGIFEYPNHYLMKKNRLIILMHNPKCEYCGKPAIEIHHKDENKANHRLSNLAAVCRKCNCRQSSKFYKRFGYTLEEITNMLGRSCIYWWKHPEEISHYLVDK